MTENEYRVLWFDPGGTSGWAMFGVDYRAFSRPEHVWQDWVTWWDCGEFTGPEEKQLDRAVVMLQEMADHGFLCGEVGSEDFDLVQLVGSTENLLSPVRINSVLNWECRKRALKYYTQNRALRIKVTPNRLRLYGFEGTWHTKGKGKDAFAAMQHGVTRIKFIKQESIRRPWKLSEGGQLNAYYDCACSYTRRAKCDLSHPR